MKSVGVRAWSGARGGANGLVALGSAKESAKSVLSSACLKSAALTLERLAYQVLEQARLDAAMCSHGEFPVFVARVEIQERAMPARASEGLASAHRQPAPERATATRQ